MSKLETLSECPLCGNRGFSTFLSCVDNTVSRETFQVVSCNACGFKLTNPRPKPTELGSYYESEEYISHSNTRKGIVNKAYGFVRKRAIRDKIRLIEKLAGKPKIELLDIGCGTGEFLYASRLHGWSVVGIEPSEKARRFGIENYGLDVRVEEELRIILSGSMDVITMWHVLEHVPDLNGRMQEIYRILKPGGALIVAVPNCDSWDAKYYGKFWAAWDVPRHLYHFTPGDMKTLLNKHNFTLVDMKPMVFDAYYVSMLSEKYKTGSASMISSTWNGWRSNAHARRFPGTWSSQIYISKKAS